MKLLLLYNIFLPLVIASCPFDHYWSDVLEKCLKCTKCRKNEIVVHACQEYKNSVCRPTDYEGTEKHLKKVSHHFQKNKIHFFDHDSDEELHMRNFIELENQNNGEHFGKHLKSKKPKHEKKHKKKIKKHFEFEEEGLMFDATSEKPKKHKKHYEFKKKHLNKKNVFLNSDENSDAKIPEILNDFEEREIEIKKKLKHRKDDLLKTLKEESGENMGGEQKVHINSPTESDDKDVDSKTEKISYQDEYAKLFKEWKTGENEKDLSSLMNDVKERIKTVTPAKRMFLGEPSTVSEMIGQIKDPEEVLKEEMGGKKWLLQKPKFRVFPVLVDSESKIDHSDITSSDNHHMRVDGEGGKQDVVSMPFSTAETLVWDWQAVALVSAVAACSFFFLVIAVYIIFSSRQWEKKAKKSYSKDDMTTRIALMHPTPLESCVSDYHTTSLYIENIAASKKEGSTHIIDKC